MKKTLTAILLGLSLITFSACSGTAETTADTTQAASIMTEINETEAATVSEMEGTTAQGEIAEETSSAENETVSEATQTAQSEEAAAEQTAEETVADDSDKILVAYFSYSGNTRAIAEKISAEAGGDIFEIDTTYDYPSEYNAVLDTAQQEKSDNARPELSATVENMEDYDVVFLGYPNWWGDMPMAVYSFLDIYDLSGKTIVPFVTSSSSGFSNTISTITNAEPYAVIAEGLSIRDNAIDSSDQTITEWLESLEY